MYKAALMDAVIFRPSMYMRRGSFGYYELLYGPLSEHICKHSCARLSAMMFSCSGIGSIWNAVIESE